MANEVVEVDAAPSYLAAVCEYTAWSGIGDTVMRLLPRLEPFRRPAGEAPAGRSVCIYQLPTDAGADLEVGVEVARPFETTTAPDVYCTTTPVGRAAHLAHYGDYSRLRDAHALIEAWCEAQGREPEGTRWEVYGDWSDDPARRRTDVYWLLAD